MDGAAVAIGAAPAANVRVVSPTTITATTPLGAVAPAVAVTVTNTDAQTHSLGASFTYRNAPTVTGLDPTRGPTAGGRTVQVTGTDFVAGVKVFLGGVEITPVTFVNATTLQAAIPPHAAAAMNVTVQNPGDPAQSAPLAAGFTYTDVPSEVGHNSCAYLIDGEDFFERLRQRFEAVRASAPNELTYVRLAFWEIEEKVTLGDRTRYNLPAHTLVTYIDQTIRAGHNVDVIVWRPTQTERRAQALAAATAQANETFARAVWDVDVAAAAAGPRVGRARVFLEQYEGGVGMSNHEKIAIFSIAGQRWAIIGGINLSVSYFDLRDHSRNAWHDAGGDPGPGTTSKPSGCGAKRTRSGTLGGTPWAAVERSTRATSRYREQRHGSDSIAENKHRRPSGRGHPSRSRPHGPMADTIHPHCDRVIDLIRAANNRIHGELSRYRSDMCTNCGPARSGSRRRCNQHRDRHSRTGGMIGYLCRRSLQMALRMSTAAVMPASPCAVMSTFSRGHRSDTDYRRANWTAGR